MRNCQGNPGEEFTRTEIPGSFARVSRTGLGNLAACPEVQGFGIFSWAWPRVALNVRSGRP